MASILFLHFFRFLWWCYHDSSLSSPLLGPPQFLEACELGHTYKYLVELGVVIPTITIDKEATNKRDITDMKNRDGLVRLNASENWGGSNDGEENNEHHDGTQRRKKRNRGKVREP